MDADLDTKFNSVLLVIDSAVVSVQWRSSYIELLEQCDRFS